MSVEFDFFIASQKKWWCHFDDDNYVNVPRLLQLLQRYNPLEDYYLGKTSIKQPLELEDQRTKVCVLRKKSIDLNLEIIDRFIRTISDDY